MIGSVAVFWMWWLKHQMKSSASLLFFLLLVCLFFSVSLRILCSLSLSGLSPLSLLSRFFCFPSLCSVMFLSSLSLFFSSFLSLYLPFVFFSFSPLFFNSLLSLFSFFFFYPKIPSSCYVLFSLYFPPILFFFHPLDPLSPLVFISGKQGGESYYPCLVMAQG
jgi:hypothetical protein